MSSANAIRFLERVSRDEKLRRKMTRARSMTDWVDAAQMAGHPVTSDGLRGAVEALAGRPLQQHELTPMLKDLFSDELSDAELDAVAGGLAGNLAERLRNLSFGPEGWLKGHDAYSPGINVTKKTP